MRKVAAATQARGTSVVARGRNWVDRQDPASHPGVAIGWLERFKLANGGLFAVLLTAYLFITALPAAIVITSYAYSDPTELADSVGDRLGLTGSTRQLLDTVLHGAGGHQLGATLIAFFDVLDRPRQGAPHRPGPVLHDAAHPAWTLRDLYRREQSVAPLGGVDRLDPGTDLAGRDPLVPRLDAAHAPAQPRLGA